MSLSRLLRLLAFALAVGAGPPGHAESPARVWMATAGLQSDYYPVGTAVCRMVNAMRRQHGLRCAADTSEGSVENIRLVLSGEYHLGLAQGDTQAAAREGTGAFAGKPQPKLRALFNLAPEVFTVMVDPQADIRSIADLAGRRVSFGPAGSGTHATSELVLAAYGLSPADLAKIVDLKFVEMAPALCERKIDAFVFVAGHPNPVFADAVNGCGARFLAIEGDRIDALLAAHPHYQRAAVPSGLYKRGGAVVPAFGTTFAVVAADDLPDAVAYAVTRSVFENLDDLRKLHPTLVGISKQSAAVTHLPLHPGAAAYFREAGVLPAEAPDKAAR